MKIPDNWLVILAHLAEEAEARGIKEGIIITLSIGIIASLIVGIISSVMLYLIVGIILALITFSICVLYFGVEGFRKIPVGFRGMRLLLGRRVAGREYPEGLVWNWPKPIGDLEIKDGRDKPFDLPLAEVLTADNVPVDIEASLQIRITDINKNLSADKPEESLKNAAESDIRSIVLRLQSSNIAQEKQVIADTMLAGVGVPQTPLEGLLLKGLTESEQLWGIKVSQVRIAHIRLPKKIEEARAEVQVQVANQAKEVQQAVAEMTEAKHVAGMIDVYKATGLSPAEAANIAQAERGKATRIILDGRADPLVQAGALAGRILDSVNPVSSSQPPSASPSKGQRRRGNT